ncbi:extracellular solute-binding protein [Salmonella enterica subsp. enterica serovar Cerro str. FSL R8-0235]|nr:extracellular solute-binding protein [Salmonella enterica subsp. enterica serovar Cerro str. FSL R8-0235]
MIARVMLLLVALVSAGAQAQEIKESYGEPKYAFNFDHFDYVNPPPYSANLSMLLTLITLIM